MLSGAGPVLALSLCRVWKQWTKVQLQRPKTCSQALSAHKKKVLRFNSDVVQNLIKPAQTLIWILNWTEMSLIKVSTKNISNQFKLDQYKHPHALLVMVFADMA